jgi:hypothetical protein
MLNSIRTESKGGFERSLEITVKAFLFFVLDALNANTLYAHSDNSPDMQKANWFDMKSRTAPQFERMVVNSFDASEVTRKLIAVHRRSPLTFCSHP